MNTTATIDLDTATRTVGCFTDFADLERRCREHGYVPTLATELAPRSRSAKAKRFVAAARVVADALASRGLKHFPRTY